MPGADRARDIAGKTFEWIFRRATLRDARAGLPIADDPRAAAARQAKLLLEIARRTAEPAEALPAGALPAVTLGLSREAIYWALAARRADGGAVPSDLRALWDASQPQTSSASPPDNEASAALRRTLFDDYAPHALAVTAKDAARAREFAEALVWDLDAPRRRVERVLIQRWLRIALLGAVLVLLVIGGRVLTLGTESGGGETVPPQLVVLGVGGLRRQQRLQRLDVPYRNGAEPLGRARSRRAQESESRRGDQPGRLLRRPRDTAGGGGEHRSRHMDAGGPPQ
jgi:hypothetical protein